MSINLKNITFLGWEGYASISDYWTILNEECTFYLEISPQTKDTAPKFITFLHPRGNNQS